MNKLWLDYYHNIREYEWTMSILDVIKLAIKDNIGRAIKYGFYFSILFLAIVFLLIILGITSSESMLERVRIDIPDITFSKAIASFYISQLPFGIILIFGNVAFFYILFL